MSCPRKGNNGDAMDSSWLAVLVTALYEVEFGIGLEEFTTFIRFNSSRIVGSTFEIFKDVETIASAARCV